MGLADDGRDKVHCAGINPGGADGSGDNCAVVEFDGETVYGSESDLVRAVGRRSWDCDRDIRAVSRKLKWIGLTALVVVAVIVFMPVVAGASGHTEELDGLKDLFKTNLDGLKVYYCALGHTALC